MFLTKKSFGCSKRIIGLFGYITLYYLDWVISIYEEESFFLGEEVVGVGEDEAIGVVVVVVGEEGVVVGEEEVVVVVGEEGVVGVR